MRLDPPVHSRTVPVTAVLPWSARRSASAASGSEPSVNPSASNMPARESGATLRFYAFGSGLVIPGSVRAWSMRHVMTETWHNYFPDPRSAPDPDPAWLAGGSAVAMIKTDRAISREHPDALKRRSSYEGPALVLYGASDIFADGTQIVQKPVSACHSGDAAGFWSRALASESVRLRRCAARLLRPPTRLPIASRRPRRLSLLRAG